VWRIEKNLDKDIVCNRFYSNYTANVLRVELLKDSETSEKQDKQCADYSVLMANGRTGLESKIDGPKLADVMKWE
jgi:hypothetical protein